MFCQTRFGSVCKKNVRISRWPRLYWPWVESKRVIRCNNCFQLGDSSDRVNETLESVEGYTRRVRRASEDLLAVGVMTVSGTKAISRKSKSLIPGTRKSLTQIKRQSLASVDESLNPRTLFRPLSNFY